MPKPIVKRSYLVALHQQTTVARELEKMLERGVIERSCSEFYNPIRVVTKKNGDVRIYLDTRFFNKVIESDNEAPPRIEELMQKYKGARYFTPRIWVKDTGKSH